MVKFKDFLPLLAIRGFSLRRKDRLRSPSVSSVMLCGSEVSLFKEKGVIRLEWNDARTVRCMSNLGPD